MQDPPPPFFPLLLVQFQLLLSPLARVLLSILLPDLYVGARNSEKAYNRVVIVSGAGFPLEVFTPDVGLRFAVASFSSGSCFALKSLSAEVSNPVFWGSSEMDGSSSSRFYTAKAEQSPSTVFDAVAEVEALTMVGAEGASTSGRSEYYSARCEAMMRRRGQFSDDVALDIEFSKSHQSEVVRVEATEEELNRKNRELLKQFRKEYPRLFRHDLAGYVLGCMIAKGGQAEIYEVVGEPNYLMKVFDRQTSLRDLRRSWPLPVLKAHVLQCIIFAGVLEDGRFAFLMYRCWGDLQKLIDQAMQDKSVDGVQGPPFPYKWKDQTCHLIFFILEIARQMENLHERGVFHRDLKASNILLHLQFDYLIMVADFECSIGVLGTGFWRAPEIFLAQEKQETITNEQWEKADVYSYGMTCFEIVTGRIPFDGELRNTKASRQLVIDGKRPQLPSDLDEIVKDLITKCWAPNPILRPTFFEIVVMIENIPTRQCQFRLFGISDELPPQYHLATVQEVDENPIALMKVMRGWEIANLANGSVDGYSYGMHTRLKKRNDVGHKLARLHH